MFVCIFKNNLIINYLFELRKRLQKYNKINIYVLLGKRISCKTYLCVNLKPDIAVVTVLRFKNILRLASFGK